MHTGDGEHKKTRLKIMFCGHTGEKGGVGIRNQTSYNALFLGKTSRPTLGQARLN
jgi:hypothetical protein